jgi:hypothetical protein
MTFDADAVVEQYYIRWQKQDSKYYALIQFLKKSVGFKIDAGIKREIKLS